MEGLGEFVLDGDGGGLEREGGREGGRVSASHPGCIDTEIGLPLPPSLLPYLERKHLGDTPAVDQIHVHLVLFLRPVVQPIQSKSTPQRLHFSDAKRNFFALDLHPIKPIRTIPIQPQSFFACFCFLCFAIGCHVGGVVLLQELGLDAPDRV